MNTFPSFQYHVERQHFPASPSMAAWQKGHHPRARNVLDRPEIEASAKTRENAVEIAQSRCSKRRSKVPECKVRANQTAKSSQQRILCKAVVMQAAASQIHGSRSLADYSIAGTWWIVCTVPTVGILYVNS